MTLFKKSAGEPARGAQVWWRIHIATLGIMAMSHKRHLLILSESAQINLRLCARWNIFIKRELSHISPRPASYTY